MITRRTADIFAKAMQVLAEKYNGMVIDEKDLKDADGVLEVIFEDGRYTFRSPRGVRKEVEGGEVQGRSD